MRLAACAAIVFGLGAATDAAAQMRPVAAFASTSSDVFGSTALATRDDPIGALLEPYSYTSAGAVVRRRTSQAQLARAHKGGAVDSLRITLADALTTPGGLPIGPDRAEVDSYAYEVAFVRDWPGAVNFDAGKFNLDVSPHAGLGVGAAGSSAEAGATLRVGRRLDDAVLARLKDIGVRDGASFGDAGRWYLFVAASGRAVGLNVLRGADGWGRQGWSTDPAAATIADAQVGLGWRSGTMQTAIGYVRREVKTDHKVWGQETKADSLVALTFSIRP